MAKIRETCICGASFEIVTAGNIEARAAAAEFRSAHSGCFDCEKRIARAEVQNEANRQEIDATRAYVEETIKNLEKAGL